MIRFTFAALGLALVAGCSDPLKTVPRLGQVDVAAPEPIVEAVAAPAEVDRKTGLFARLLRKREVGETAMPAVDPEATTDASPTQGDAPIDTTDADTAADLPQPEVADARPAPEKRRGLLGLFSRDKARSVTSEDDAQITRAALDTGTPSIDARPDPAPSREARGGLFSRSKAARLTGPDAREAQPGEVLPFGTVARACHMKRADLGREVAKYPETRPRYRVHDSAPGTQALHTFYITGFDDGCPRQVTAALVVFGSASMYEALRYGLPDSARSSRPTDAAYEKLKSKVCKVGRKKPCGSRIGRMEKTAVFLSVYNRFEGASGWSNLLVADGEVLAMDTGG